MLGLQSTDVESMDGDTSDRDMWKEQPSPQPRPIPAMSQWAKVQQNTKIFSQMQQFYQSPFTMEVRFFLCQWIEQQQWDQIDETNQQYAEIAERILKEMMQLLCAKAEELTSSDYFIIRYKLQESVQQIESMAQNNPLDLIHTIKQCLEKERQLIVQQEQVEQQQHLPQNFNATDQKDISEKIMADIQNLLRKSIATENDLKHLQHAQESFIIKFSDSQKITGEMQQLANMPATPEKTVNEMQLKKQKEELDLQLAKMAQALLVDRTKLSQKYEGTIQGLEKLQQNILDIELIAWKRRQQLAGNGLVMDPSSLETLQKWCESLADLIWQNRQQIKKTTQLQQQLPISCPDGIEDLLPVLNDTITGLLSSLVTSTFIVEQQPPQVLKKDARFGAVVRLLVGGKLNVHMNPPIVKATIISENQAKDLLRNEANAKNDTCGDILNNNGSMEYHQTTSQLSISFRNMQLKKIKRADKKGSEAVTEEKFCILFQSEFSVGGNELSFHVWTLSLPVVVTVHGNQECNATATVLWDNAFSEASRIPFSVPDTVEWKLLADQLTMKFMSQTGKGLSETNLSYIASKLFGEADPSNLKVSWAQFNKDTLPGRTFTFWEWFYAIQKLTKEHLKDVWTNGAIIGFVSKKMSTDWLSSKAQGTFLLRFSDSEIGGITIAWIGRTASGDCSEVWNLAPFTTKDFNIRGLADRIKDLTSLVYLYPNTPKDTMFSKYYSMTEENVNHDGYIRPVLKTTIPQQFNQQDIDMHKPFSPDQPIYETGPMSNMALPENFDELPQNISNDLAEVDLNSLMDYNTSDIHEISVSELIANQSI